jgi:hypothetical protein
LDENKKTPREGNVQKNPLEPGSEQPDRETPSSGPDDTDRPGVSTRREEVKKVSEPQDVELSEDEATEAHDVGGKERPETHRPGRMGGTP